SWGDGPLFTQAGSFPERQNHKPRRLIPFRVYSFVLGRIVPRKGGVSFSTNSTCEHGFFAASLPPTISPLGFSNLPLSFLILSPLLLSECMVESLIPFIQRMCAAYVLIGEENHIL